MTSGVLTDTDRAEPGDVTARQPAADVRPEKVTVPDIVRRTLGRPSLPPQWFWPIAVLVTLLGGGLRAFNLAHPPDKVFDELYYADEAHDLLGHGVEWNPDDNTPQYVVHPPLGKWMIAIGERF